ncbi:hypothetical protein C1I98_16440, partial [Spongiactinospora gelatinilytica]
QAAGVFDNVTVEGGTTGRWDSDSVGEMNHTDWEKHHNASGAVEKDGFITISGTGDIGPLGEEGTRTVESTLPGLPVVLIIVVVVAARHGARTSGAAASRRVILTRAVVVAGATFVTGLVAAGVVLPAGMASLAGNGIVVPTLPVPTGARVIVGLAAVLALCAVVAYALGVRLHRGWSATLAGVSLIALPFAVTAFPLLPDAVSDWLMRLTPAAGFAVKQTMAEYPQVTAHYAPSAGYLPLPGWAGLTVLCAYTVITMLIAIGPEQAERPDRPR